MQISGVIATLSPRLSLKKRKKATKKASISCSSEHSSNTTAMDAVQMIDRTMCKTVVDLFHMKLSEEHSGLTDPFYIVDLGEIQRKHMQWVQMLPRVQPFYAVKCNPDRVILELLASLGTGFDCASKNEMDLVRGLNVSEDRIIFANCCKPGSHLDHMARNNVNMMTFDNADELDKIKKHHPNADLVLRILTDDSNSLCKLGLKFGASLENVPHLLAYAQKLGLPVMGISFHVGSGCFDASAFTIALKLARHAFDIAPSYGHVMTLLDIGGGFPGTDVDGITFKDICDAVNPALAELFPSPDIRVIAEPGRYYVSSSHVLATNVYARRVVRRDDSDSASIINMANDHPKFMYYVNDGVYGSFNCIVFDHAVVAPKALPSKPLNKNGELVPTPIVEDVPLFSSSLWGPTCDSFDCISKGSMLPEIQIGDWLYFENMGAYTRAAASTFNGFEAPTVYYIHTTDLL